MSTIGDIINGRWKLVEELKSNTGQGNTYFVEDLDNPDSSRKCIIKLLKNVDSRSVIRFQKEIRSSLALKHRNIVKVIDSAYKDADVPYLVTEYCSGGELTPERVKVLPIIERLKMFEAICEAIAHAHQAGVIHRDIKPGNIFLESPDSLAPIVGDFGLCYLKGDDPRERPTLDDESIGNWEFGPPQGHMGRQDSPNETFDVYNLGKLLYWFLSDGKTLYREYYDRPNYDLRGEGAEHVIHLAYDVMGRSINENSASLYLTADKMAEEASKLVMFAEKDGRYLDCDIPQSCVFCRVGRYDWQFLGEHENDRYQFAEYGLSFNQPQSVIYPRLLLGRCWRCGNIQQFRLDDRAKLSAQWKNVPRSPHARTI